MVTQPTAVPGRREKSGRAPAPRTPALIAIERLAKMAAAGANGSKMVATLNGILISWGSEDMHPDDLRERIKQLQSDIDAGAQAAEDYVAEAETAAGRAAAEGQLEALVAVKAKLAEVISA